MGSMRIGFGYDSHRFDEARPLVLGGVQIPNYPGFGGTPTGMPSPMRSRTPFLAPLLWVISVGISPPLSPSGRMRIPWTCWRVR